eukprot:364925-Chlamydomonas_euryale.AAC.4
MAEVGATKVCGGEKRRQTLGGRKGASEGCRPIACRVLVWLECHRTAGPYFMHTANSGYTDVERRGRSAHHHPHPLLTADLPLPSTTRPPCSLRVFGLGPLSEPFPGIGA